MNTRIQVGAGPNTTSLDLSTISALLNQAVPAGSILPSVLDTAPTSYLECDGSQKSRSLYPALFAAIGVKFGIGDGATTFNLPPNGLFLRSVDSNGNDPDINTRSAVIAGTQTMTGDVAMGSALVSNVSNILNVCPGMTVSGAHITGGTHVISVNVAGNSFTMSTTGLTNDPGETLTLSKSATIGYIGSFQDHMFASHTHTYAIGITLNGGIALQAQNTATNTSTSAAGGSETRPRNVYVKFFIKY